MASARRRRHRLVAGGVLMAVAVAATACGSGTSSASVSASTAKTTRGHRHGAAGGLVSAVSPTSVTVRAKGATSTVALNAATKYREARRTVTASALVAGDRVRIRLVNGDAIPTAASVTIAPPSVTGTVGAVSAGGFTLTARTGPTRTVTTTSTTTYRMGKQTVSAASLRNGDRARVTGPVGSSGAISATMVTILPGKPR